MSIEEKAEEYRSDTFGTPFRNDIKMALVKVHSGCNLN